jgi:hypothetical protein
LYGVVYDELNFFQDLGYHMIEPAGRRANRPEPWSARQIMSADLFLVEKYWEKIVTATILRDTQ